MFKGALVRDPLSLLSQVECKTRVNDGDEISFVDPSKPLKKGIEPPPKLVACYIAPPPEPEPAPSTEPDHAQIRYQKQVHRTLSASGPEVQVTVLGCGYTVPSRLRQVLSCPL